VTNEELEAYKAAAELATQEVLKLVLDRMPTPRMAILVLEKAAAHIAHASGDSQEFMLEAAESAYEAVGQERREILERRRNRQ
jgi:hypothetical protein